MAAKRFRHAGHPPSLIAALLHFDVSFMVWVLLAALGAYAAADLDLGSAEKGLMSGALFAVGTLAAALTLLPGLAATVVLLFATLACLGTGNGAVFQLVPQRFPRRIGAVTGLVGAAGGVGGFILPFALGSLEELTGSFAVGFLFMASAATVAAWAVARRDRAWRRNPVQLEVAVA